jgi:hypothetical protein
MSPAGRKATTKPAHEVIRLIWDKWLRTSLVDEFNRINVIKGQQGKGRGGLTAVAPRRQSVVAVMDRFAERRSEAVWQLHRSKVLSAVEEGLTVGELKDFLGAKNQEPLPQTVEAFLNDLQQKVGQLEDLGAARLIRCADAHLARLLAGDRRLRKLCTLAGDHHLVFRATDETAVRRGLRELGYVLPRAY